MKRVLVCGDRHWTDRESIRLVLSQYPPGTVIIHGDNGKVDPETGEAIEGADKLTGEVARELGFEVVPVPAEWTKFGRAAGPIRNKRMLEEERPDEGIAFHRDISKSKGTKNMVNQLRKAGKPVKVFTG